jgi:hypothetical protein
MEKHRFAELHETLGQLDDGDLQAVVEMAAASLGVSPEQLAAALNKERTLRGLGLLRMTV